MAGFVRKMEYLEGMLCIHTNNISLVVQSIVVQSNDYRQPFLRKLPTVLFDSKETYLANVPLALRRTGTSSRNFGKISFFAITCKLSTREQSATFHDHRSN